MDRFTYDSPEYEAYMQEHTHERGEIRFLESVAREGMIAVDAGGHFGFAACAISRTIGESGRLYCFEPIPEYREILRDNLKKNALRNVEVVPAALGKQAGKMRLYKDGDGTSIVPKPDREAVEVDLVQLDEFLGTRGQERLVHHEFLKALGQSVHDLLGFLRGRGYSASTVSLSDLKLGEDWDTCEYLYARR